MMAAPAMQARPEANAPETLLAGMIEYLRAVVLSDPGRGERFHTVFLDSRRTYLGDETLGQGGRTSLSLRMRDLFGSALSIGARSIIVAHNHPSGICRPSQNDIEATRRLSMIGQALDIELLDHLVFTQSAVYSMRAGGQL